MPFLFITKYSEDMNPVYIYINDDYIFVGKFSGRGRVRPPYATKGEPIISNTILPIGMRVIRSLRHDVRIYPDGRAEWNGQELMQLDPSDYVIDIRVNMTLRKKRGSARNTE